MQRKQNLKSKKIVNSLKFQVPGFKLIFYVNCSTHSQIPQLLNLEPET